MIDTQLMKSNLPRSAGMVIGPFYSRLNPARDIIPNALNYEYDSEDEDILSEGEEDEEEYHSDRSAAAD